MDQGLTLTMCISFSIYRGTLPSLWNLLSNRWFQDEETNLSLCQSYLHQEWCNEVILLRYSYSYIAPTGDQQHPSHFSLYQIKCIYEEAFDVEPVMSVVQLDACECDIPVNFGIPCKHVLPLNGPVPLNMIPIRYRIDISDSEGICCFFLC